MKRMLIITLVLVFTGCNQTEQKSHQDNQIEIDTSLTTQQRIDTFHREGFLYEFESSPQGVRAAFGEPVQVESALVENRYVPNQTDITYDFRYQGLDIDLYWIPAEQEGLLNAVEVTSSDWDKIKWNMSVGIDKSAMLRLFGTPDDTIGVGTYLYICCERSVESPTIFTILADTIYSIYWDYYVD
ncbi:MAG: hypothetical protein GF372_00285 [Candidatus Marinimicrobia bacterium]|nr:hypothetical protein [Candidatus Neomarinimicrobiota bacterium]